jgi:ankyrin repeat protein
VLSGASDLCHWLYVNGAADDLHVKDHSGKTPIDVAVEAGDEELCEWLAHTGHLRDEEV